MNKLIPSFPVQTSRLRLRPLWSDDVDALLAYRSLPDVCRYVPFEPLDYEIAKEKLSGNWARRTITNEGEALTLGVELSETEELIGDVMLQFKSELHRDGEVGWILNPNFGGRGYATEAAHAVLHLAFDQLQLHRVTARIDARNVPSLRVADRLGMRREAHLKSNQWFKGEWSDEIDLALLEDEWTVMHHGDAMCLTEEVVTVSVPASKLGLRLHRNHLT